MLFRACTELAGCAALVGKDRQELRPADRADRARHAELAMDFLRQAVAQGYQNVYTLAQDEQLAPLRGREDFRALVDRLGPAK